MDNVNALYAPWANDTSTGDVVSLDRNPLSDGRLYTCCLDGSMKVWKHDAELQTLRPIYTVAPEYMLGNNHVHTLHVLSAPPLKEGLLYFVAGTDKFIRYFAMKVKDPPDEDPAEVMKRSKKGSKDKQGGSKETSSTSNSGGGSPKRTDSKQEKAAAGVDKTPSRAGSQSPSKDRSGAVESVGSKGAGTDQK